MLKGIKEVFPRLYGEIRKNASNILPVLQKFGEKNSTHLEALEKETKKIGNKLCVLFTSTAKEHGLQIQSQSIQNLVNLLINSPHQRIDIIIKKAAEIEEIFNNRYVEPDSIFVQESEMQDTPEEKIQKLDYYPQSVPENFASLVIPEIIKSAICQVFYYEEDYYDCVTSQALLIDIGNNTIRYGNGTKIFSKEMLANRNIVPNERLEAQLKREHPPMDYYFLHLHGSKWLQCIGGVSLSKDNFPVLHIFNTDQRLRYGTKYINKYNNQYREGSCTKDGDILPELVAKDTVNRMQTHYHLS